MPSSYLLDFDESVNVDYCDSTPREECNEEWPRKTFEKYPLENPTIV